jgi:hypothetical protein
MYITQHTTLVSHRGTSSSRPVHRAGPVAFLTRPGLHSIACLATDSRPLRFLAPPHQWFLKLSFLNIELWVYTYQFLPV